MAITTKAQAFRRLRANELRRFARVLGKLENCTVHPIYDAANQLEDFGYVPSAPSDAKTNYDNWGYHVNGIGFPLSPTPKNTHPQKAYNLNLTLGVQLVSACTNFAEEIIDPCKHLEFNIVITGNYSKPNENKTVELITSYHLDRHLLIANDNEAKEIHPIYHFQFGGRKLNTANRDFGCSLILDSPRIVHYPMDIVLGVDFVLANFYAEGRNKLLREREYLSILEDYQRFFCRPYAHTTACHWQPFDNGNIKWNPRLTWPHLVSN